MNTIIKEHKLYKKQIITLAKYDIIKSYRGAKLGWIWAIIKPMITIFTYWFTLAIGLKVSKDMYGYPYFLWLISGIIPWFYINEMLTHTSNSMNKYSYLINKMNFPTSIIPTFVSLAKLFIHCILVLIMLAIFLICNQKFDVYYLQIPLYTILMVVFFTAFSLLTSVLSVMSKDFLNLIKSIVHTLFWLSGIIWDVDGLKITWLKKLLYFNPITFIVNGYRNCFIKKIWIWEQPIQLIVFAIITIIIIILACYIYNKNKKDIPDII